MTEQEYMTAEAPGEAHDVRRHTATSARQARTSPSAREKEQPGHERSAAVLPDPSKTAPKATNSSFQTDTGTCLTSAEIRLLGSFRHRFQVPDSRLSSVCSGWQ